MCAWRRARLDRTSRKAGSWNNTLLGAVQPNAKCPPIVVFMQKAYELASGEAHLIFKSGPEVKLNAMYARVGWATCCGNSSSSR